MAATNTTAPDVAGSPPMLIDIAGVAARLGVPVRHVRRLVAERQIPYLKWRRLLRFDPAEIEEWLDAARHAPDPGRRPFMAPG